MTANDLDLLMQFTRDQSQDAFTALVQRHVNLVYSTALRQVRSPQLAEEVAQSVFTDLAHTAATLKPDTILTAWLYQVTRRTAIDVVRRESRRQARERLAVEITTMNACSSDWTHIEPLLDDAMESLDARDRAAVLLRYFENKPLREVGAVLGTSDDAAQKRVSRAVEHLREFLVKRGITVAASGLVFTISANAVQPAPIGLAATFSAAALAGTHLITATSTSAAHVIVMTTLQKTLIGAMLVVATGTGVYEAYQSSILRHQVRALQQQAAPLMEQIAQLQRERDEAKSRLTALSDEIATLNTNAVELVKLRRQVTELRSANAASDRAGADTLQSAAKSWADRVTQLKQRLEQTQGAAIPEFKYLTEANWLNAAKDPLVTDKDFRQAFASLRSAGENQFIILMQKALGTYLKQSNGQFPSDLSQLKPYFETPPDDAMLQRYGIVSSSSIPNMKMGGDWLITVTSPVDKDYDPLWVLGERGFGSTTYQGQNEATILAPASKAYQAANNGQEPKNSSDLLPYLTTPEQQAAYQKLEQMRNAGEK
jgi:RNA polymerase sigma factor (sigma-70 family)